jgi:hypothetical protein
VLLALPAAAVAMVVLRYLHEKYTASNLYQPAEAEPEASGVVVVSHGAVVAASEFEAESVAVARSELVLPDSAKSPAN